MGTWVSLFVCSAGGGGVLDFAGVTFHSIFAAPENIDGRISQNGHTIYGRKRKTKQKNDWYLTPFSRFPTAIGSNCLVQAESPLMDGARVFWMPVVRQMKSGMSRFHLKYDHMTFKK
jgi:hypothetical protein